MARIMNLSACERSPLFWNFLEIPRQILQSTRWRRLNACSNCRGLISTSNLRSSTEALSADNSRSGFLSIGLLK